MQAVMFKEETLKQVRVLAGSLTDLTQSSLTPFGKEVISFLADLSRALLKDTRAKRLPDVVSFAYWCRKSNLCARKSLFEGSAYSHSRLGRGLSFHITPSNIPVNFAFSYAFGLLAGNACIVRVPSKQTEQCETICKVLGAILEQHPSIAIRTAIVSYPIDDGITAEFSSRADARLIWGGDATIARIRSLPSSPRCKDVVFSDRYSVGLVDGSVLATTSTEELSRLAESFFNDTYLMDQNACSSPQMIFWLNATKEAKTRFWSAVRDIAFKRYKLQEQVSMDKYLRLCEDILHGIVEGRAVYEGILMVVDIKHLPADICGMRGVGGYFYQHDIAQLSEVIPYLNEKFQTLVYYGFDPQELQKFFLNASARGIDRIVPLGAAMDIDLVWDGYNLIEELSRILAAK